MLENTINDDKTITINNDKTIAGGNGTMLAGATMFFASWARVEWVRFGWV